MCVFTLGSGTVTIRKLNSKISFFLVAFLNCQFVILADQRSGSSIQIFSVELNMTHAVENSVMTASVHSLALFSFSFLSSACCPVELLSRHLIKVSGLFTLDISSIAPGMFSSFLPECANREIKTVFVVPSAAASVASVSQVPLVHSDVFSSSLNEPSVGNSLLSSCRKPMCITSTLFCFYHR